MTQLKTLDDDHSETNQGRNSRREKTLLDMVESCVAHNGRMAFLRTEVYYCPLQPGTPVTCKHQDQNKIYEEGDEVYKRCELRNRSLIK